VVALLAVVGGVTAQYGLFNCTSPQMKGGMNNCKEDNPGLYDNNKNQVSLLMCIFRDLELTYAGRFYCDRFSQIWVQLDCGEDSEQVALFKEFLIRESIDCCPDKWMSFHSMEIIPYLQRIYNTVNDDRSRQFNMLAAFGLNSTAFISECEMSPSPCHL